GGGGDPDQPAGRVEERAAGEAVVHRRRGANHLVDGAAPPGRERPADDGDDACAGGDDVAPGSRDGEGEVAYSGTRDGRRERPDVETGHAQHRQAGRRIPAGDPGLERSTVV